MQLWAVPGLPEIAPGASLGELIAARAGLEDGDVVAIAQKALSKAEGRTVLLADVEPGSRAIELAGSLGEDPALIELVLQETRTIIRSERVLIVETLSGLVCANAGIDSSNTAAEGTVVLLPRNPDASARRLRTELQEASGARLAVIVTDSFGRPWRIGQCEVAIGCAGLHPLDDWRGRADRDGRELTATEIALADEIAAAADLVRDKSSGEPAVIVRGLGTRIDEADGPGAGAMRRAAQDDLFR
ncbi:MAG: coenzyme F420-0:L-glutamate ligase [Solirubrobacterales bacterium]|nr:coenzyme F420-0:L-glutamate ligase [Solirubrobacterales bacterium]